MFWVTDKSTRQDPQNGKKLPERISQSSCGGLWRFFRKWCLLSVYGTTFLFLFVSMASADWLLLFHTEAGRKLGDRIEGKVEVEVKARDNMSEWYDTEVMPWVAYAFTDRFKWGVGWRVLYTRVNRNVYSRNSSREVTDRYWEVESRPLMDLMTRLKTGDWPIDHRLRIEHRHREHLTPYFRYRNRLRLSSPWKWTRIGLNPWIGLESYWEASPTIHGSDRLNRHRLFFGMGSKGKLVKTGWYYYREFVRVNKNWSPNNEIGFELSFAY